MLVNKGIESQTILPAGGEIGDINMGVTALPREVVRGGKEKRNYNSIHNNKQNSKSSNLTTHFIGGGGDAFAKYKGQN